MTPLDPFFTSAHKIKERRTSRTYASANIFGRTSRRLKEEDAQKDAIRRQEIVDSLAKRGAKRTKNATKPKERAKSAKKIAAAKKYQP